MSDILNRTDFTGKSHIVLITGGSGSGKSAFAENLVLKQPAENRYYLATMQVYGSEGRERVMRHRQLRHGKGFETLEYPTDVADCIGKIHQPTDAVVLLECMSNLVANEMFTETGTLHQELVIRKITRHLRKLFDAVCHAFSTTATGGYSTKQDSVAYWNSPFIEYVIAIFMVLSGINFSLYFMCFKGKFLE